MGSEIATDANLDPGDVAELRVLIPTGYGLNCEAETAAAFRLLGARVELSETDQNQPGAGTPLNMQLLVSSYYPTEAP